MDHFLTVTVMYLVSFSLPLCYLAELPTTQLGTHLEKRVNHFLQSSGSGAGEVTIRVVSSSSKIIETKLGMREKYAGEFPLEMPYRTKAMFVFEEIDGVDVCFFGMHVQEYSSDCPTPNTRYMCVCEHTYVHAAILTRVMMYVCIGVCGVQALVCMYVLMYVRTYVSTCVAVLFSIMFFAPLLPPFPCLPPFFLPSLPALPPVPLLSSPQACVYLLPGQCTLLPAQGIQDSRLPRDHHWLHGICEEAGVSVGGGGHVGMWASHEHLGIP